MPVPGASSTGYPSGTGNLRPAGESTRNGDPAGTQIQRGLAQSSGARDGAGL